MLNEYNPLLLGFVISVTKNLNAVKQEIVESIRKLESDDKAYTYSDSNDFIPRWPGKAVSQVANFNESIIIHEGIKKTVKLMALEDVSYQKTVFIITDTFDENIKQKWLWAMLNDGKLGMKVNYILCDLSTTGLPHLQKILNSHPRCTVYQHFSEVTDLGKFLKENQIFKLPPKMDM